MRKKIIHYIGTTIGMIVFLVLCILFFRACTSPEMWYAGEHDSQCEVMLNGGDYERDDCGCYKRLLEADRQRSEELRKQKK